MGSRDTLVLLYLAPTTPWLQGGWSTNYGQVIGCTLFRAVRGM